MSFVIEQHTMNEIFYREGVEENGEFLTHGFVRSAPQYRFPRQFLADLRANDIPLFVFIHGMGVDGVEMLSGDLINNICVNIRD